MTRDERRELVNAVRIAQRATEGARAALEAARPLGGDALPSRLFRDSTEDALGAALARLRAVQIDLAHVVVDLWRARVDDEIPADEPPPARELRRATGPDDTAMRLDGF